MGWGKLSGSKEAQGLSGVVAPPALSDQPMRYSTPKNHKSREFGGFRSFKF